MKHILLIILSLFVYQSYCADDHDGTVSVSICGKGIWENIQARNTDTVEQIIKKLLVRRQSVNIKPDEFSLYKGSAWGRDKICELQLDQTVENADLLKHVGNGSDMYINMSTDKEIQITFRTLTGANFKIKCNIFMNKIELDHMVIEKARTELENGVADERLRQVYQGLRNAGITLRFVHNRHGNIDTSTCVDQIVGLIEDPNLTFIIE